MYDEEISLPKIWFMIGLRRSYGLKEYFFIMKLVSYAKVFCKSYFAIFYLNFVYFKIKTVKFLIKWRKCKNNIYLDINLSTTVQIEIVLI